MERQTIERFSQAGDLGIVLAHEMLLKQSDGAARFLTDFVAGKRLDCTFDILLDCTVNHRNSPGPVILAAFGKAIAPRLVDALASAKPEGKTILVWALDKLSYTNCAPALGKLLMQLHRSESGDLPRRYSYDAYDGSIGLAIAAALEHFSGHHFVPKTASDQRSTMERIDDCKSWWQETGQHMDWKTTSIKFEGFPHPPPIADADPSIRHPEPVEIPTAMEVVRKGDSLTVSFPKFQTTNLLVGFKMVIGFNDEEFITVGGEARLRGTSVGAFQPTTNVMILGRQGLPPPGQEFVLEHRITLFETDVPTQHMWTPQSGKHYKILWTRTFRETIK